MSLAGWIPTGLVRRGGRLRVELRDLRGVAFRDPFFEQTIERAVREPYRLLFVGEADLDELPRVSGPEPTGFIFHGSRCGSTLLAAMLRELDGSLVVSEAPVVDQLLRAPMSPERRRETVRWLLAALARGAGGEQRRYFVKLDSWSVRDLPVLRGAFPGVPWVFVYREPAEVLRSQLRVRGMQMVPGVLDPALFDLAPTDLPRLTPEEYCARVLASMYRAAADGLDGDGRLVNYAGLPQPGLDDVLAHFGIARTPTERARMDEAGRWEAKNPRLFFDPVRPPVPPAARAAAERFVDEPYRRLEALRAVQDGNG